MGAHLDEVPGETSKSGGKVYVIREDPVPERVDEYFEFAHQFNGYVAYPDNLGELANGVCKDWYEALAPPDDLTLLRSCLFYEARRSHFVWGFPSESDMGYLDALVAKIKDLMAQN